MASPTAIFTRLDKKINSTKGFSGGSSHSCTLKNPTSRENPVLIINDIGFPDWNYMKFNGWYYWITDIISLDRNRFEVHGKVDPLATFKDDIKKTKGFINYGPTQLNDTELNDPRLTADVIHEVMYDEQEFDIMDIISSPSGEKLGNGCVVMRILSNQPSNAGIKTIVGSLSDYFKFISTYGADVTTSLNGVAGYEKLLGQFMGYTLPMETIKSAIWLPIQIGKLQGDAYTGDFSGYPVVGTWYDVKQDVIRGAVQSSYANLAVTLDSNVTIYPWLKSSKYLSLVLNTPGGTLNLSSNNKIFDYGNQINFRCRLMVTIDGDCTLYVYAPISIGTDTKYEIVGIQRWNCASDVKSYIYKLPSPGLEGFKQGIKIGSAILQVGGGVMMEGGANLASKSGAESFGAKVGSGIYNMGEFGTNNREALRDITSGITGSIPTQSMNEGVATFSGATNITALYANENLKTLRLYAILWKPEIFNGVNNTLDPTKYNKYCNEYGYPVFSHGDMETYNGFYQMAGASCSAKAPPASLSTINSFLNSGIIIEDD